MLAGLMANRPDSARTIGALSQQDVRATARLG
ncbi:hypothetical protein PUN4_320051 [Paraburkholderia unamae]|nr:hypothetical protein PUN4_320051 [Paraburkholderia unamae]